MAAGLAEAGADTIGVSASLEAEGSAVAKAVEYRGRKFYSYQCDFSDRDALYDFIAMLQDAHSHIDILVNNVAVIRRAPIVDHVDERRDEVIDVNFNTQFIPCH